MVSVHGGDRRRARTPIASSSMPFEQAALCAPIVLTAYAVFGLTGFGAAMIAVPALVQVMPLQTAVPMIVLFDLVSTALVGSKNRRQVSLPELKRLLPWMLVGIAAGTTLLHNLSPRWPLIALGTFVLLICLRNLAGAASANRNPIAKGWAAPFGTAGGAFSALFGTGGPIYTIYLARRLPDLGEFRATISVIILLSGISRATVFGVSGLYSDTTILWTAAGLLPVSLLGVFAGSRLRTWVSSSIIQRVILLLLALGGMGAIYRGWATPP